MDSTFLWAPELATPASSEASEEGSWRWALCLVPPAAVAPPSWLGEACTVCGVPTTRSSKTTKTSAAESAPLPDYVKYVAALDAKARRHMHGVRCGVCTACVRCVLVCARVCTCVQECNAFSLVESHSPCLVRALQQEYHACYSKLVDVRNLYVKADLAVKKNAKRLTDPRGEGDGSGRNYSSMF